MSDFNIHSVSKTNLYRTMRSRIREAIPGISENEIRELIGPMVQKRLNKENRRKQAMTIAMSVLNEHGETNLVVQEGGKVVAKDEVKPKKTKAKNKRRGGPPEKTPEERADFKVLMEQFVRCCHEQNLNRVKVAESIGVSPACIKNWLNSPSMCPTMPNAKGISKLIRNHNYHSPSRFL